ncbi:trans-sulfuration enzyme family protein [Fodinibius halophilus]|uniref:Aminotransferase class I/II-fold pyridoxal phosphate-dependent enzyme n=1 Tax=Fodinibius halophilus TaxID=1736908 RepID=A0A6M1SU25_9BACT|nr:aminotransferase class I/II-fold pyridoxal phosphate-dependent enzyme [Fodinibius halophilus]NGP87448.1 aminotransferase class I/II-fold pyridoxal phosphate-dependent enzyme [Fodinibius halophilus]
MHTKTKAIHAAMEVVNQNPDIVPPVHRSTVYELDKEGRSEDDWHYTRLDNPNRVQWEHVLKVMEDGEAAAAFSSGVAAASAVFQALEPGNHIIIPEDVYAGNRKLVKELMQPWGLKADFIDMTDLQNIKAHITGDTKLIWVETPSNPMMNIMDIGAITSLAHENGALVCVDNTWPTPINQKPLDLGSDLVLHSTTKYFGGHSDILGGAIVSAEQDGIFEKIRMVQRVGGAVPSPDDCWMLARSTRTLPYRMRGHNENAELLARFLQNHHKVEKVFYPGLATHAGHEVAEKQMTDFGGMISFLVDGDADDAIDIVGRSKLIGRATSLGGVESTWEHRRSSEGEDSITPKNLIRISVGLEHADDLLEDLDQALV